VLTLLLDLCTTQKQTRVLSYCVCWQQFEPVWWQLVAVYTYCHMNAIWNHPALIRPSHSNNPSLHACKAPMATNSCHYIYCIQPLTVFTTQSRFTKTCFRLSVMLPCITTNLCRSNAVQLVDLLVQFCMHAWQHTIPSHGRWQRDGQAIWANEVACATRSVLLHAQYVWPIYGDIELVAAS
jgi:hypothetical protein